jgi:hypothetical protein
MSNSEHVSSKDVKLDVPSDPWAALKPVVADYSILVTKIISAIQSADDAKDKSVNVGGLILNHTRVSSVIQSIQMNIKKNLEFMGYSVEFGDEAGQFYLSKERIYDPPFCDDHYSCVISWP